MDAFVWGFIGTIIGAAVGATASILTTVINTKNTHRLQVNADKLKKQERHNELQLQNLMGLQNDLSDYMRLIFRAHLSDVKQFNSGELGSNKPLLEESLDEEIRESRQKLSIIVERVSDDILRNKIQSTISLASNVLDANSDEESTYSVHLAAENMAGIIKSLGSNIRKLYKM
jgi:gas vesicle protein